jgi:hypothetical protein
MSISQKIKKGIACDSVGKPESILGRTVCISAHPGKMLLFPFIHWFEMRYKGKYKFARTLFSIDLMLIGLIFGLGLAALVLGIYKPTTFADKIQFEATVAPREIVTGAPSTLIIRYTNNTDEELRDAELSLEYPDHFLLQELSAGAAVVEDDFIELGTVLPGGTGTVRVRGVMFGDVGGEQTFRSTLRFIHGIETSLIGQKTSVHTFSPNSSTLSLVLNLPGRLVAFQDVEGVIEYSNTGDIDFPVISIEPEWPNGFSFSSSPTTFSNGRFELPAIKAGDTGLLEFEGFLGDVGEEVTFIFHPSFTFDSEHYTQETLTHTAPVVPPQIQVEQSQDKSTLAPGSETVFTLTYENTGELTVSDLVLSIESESPFFTQERFDAEAISSVEPNETGTVEIRIPLRSSVKQSETDTYENLSITTQAVATYTLGDGSGQRVVAKSSTITSAMTTPLILESFARYATASGDQLGRGPLPPRVGAETKYWIFWHVDATTNPIENVRIEGTLSDSVRFTGRQTSSQNGGVTYDSETHTINWESDLVSPTLSPTSKVIGLAFELGITPTEEQVNTIPVLLSDILITATDAQTGAFVSSRGATVTTNLPNDLMAEGLSQVR